MENEEILQEEESSILTLTDENGEETDFEYMDSIVYNDVEYLVLMPLDAENRLVVLAVHPVDEEYEDYLAVEDEDILDTVYDIFKERHKDTLRFED